ncbi:MAG: TetR/AcrR family transcriptional regulator [Anaerolineales bacterium]
MDDSISLTRGEHTQEIILKAAYALFLQKGYHGTSMRQIAAQSKLTVGSIYNHFENKEQIFLAVLKRYHPLFEILPRLMEIRAVDIQEFLSLAAKQLTDHLNTHKDFLNLMFIELVEFRANHIPDVLDTIMSQINQLELQFVPFEPQLRQIPLRVLIRAFLGMFIAYSITEMFLNERFSAYPSEQTFDIYLNIFLHGILVDGETNL